MIRHFTGIFTLLCLPYGSSSETMLPTAAVLAQLRLEKLDEFVHDHMHWSVNDYLTRCKTNSGYFKGNCTDQGVQASSCSIWSCSDDSHSTQESCTAAPATWSEQGDAANSICCGDGDLECKFDPQNLQEEWDCCDSCLDANSPTYSIDCIAESLEGPSICGTTQGHCYECVGADPRGGPRTDQGSCTSSGMCTIANEVDQAACETQSGTWSAATWVENTSLTIGETCEAEDYCGSCSNSAYGDISGCLNNGDQWLAASDAPTEDACNSKSNHQWVKLKEWESGTELPAPPLTRAECSTGPAHTITSEYCTSEVQYLQDAAIMSFQDALKNDTSLYETLGNRWRDVARAIVTNSADATDRARLTLEGGCLITIFEPKNKGKIKVNGNAQSYIIISRPTNYADAESITVRSASVVVLGGTSGGPIDLADSPKVEVYNVINTGSIIATRAQDVFIGYVTNAVGGNIQVSDVTATLNYIINKGTVTVKGPGGKYAAYNIINEGSIVIEAGQVDIRTVCPSAGTITVSEGVTGTVHYEEGCKGEITVPSTVTLESAKKTARVMEGNFGMTVPDADAFVQDGVAKDAIAEGFAEAINVQKSWLELTATKATDARRMRRPANGKERLLAGTAVTIDYTLTIPDDESTAVANMAQGRLESITVAELSASVAAKVKAVKGDSYSVSVTSISTPTISEDESQYYSHAPTARIHFAFLIAIVMFLTRGLGSLHELSHSPL